MSVFISLDFSYLKIVCQKIEKVSLVEVEQAILAWSFLTFC